MRLSGLGLSVMVAAFPLTASAAGTQWIWITAESKGLATSGQTSEQRVTFELTGDPVKVSRSIDRLSLLIDNNGNVCGLGSRARAIALAGHDGYYTFHNKTLKQCEKDAFHVEPLQGSVRGIQVCTGGPDDRRKEQVVGLRVFGTDGKPSEVTVGKRCKTWAAAQRCPTDYLVTALTLHHDGKGIVGLQPRCNLDGDKHRK